MKGFGCPKATLGLLRLIDQLCQLRGLLIIDNGHSAWPLFDNQHANTALIETVNPLSQSTIVYQQCIADKLSVGTGQDHLDGATACNCFIRAQPRNLLEFFNGRVFRMGNE